MKEFLKNTGMTRCQTEQIFSIWNSTQAGSKGCYFKDQNELNIHICTFLIGKIGTNCSKISGKNCEKNCSKLLRKNYFYSFGKNCEKKMFHKIVQKKCEKVTHFYAG